MYLIASYKQVREEDFIFIWYSSVLEYVQGQVPCDTVKIIGKIFGKLGYGFPLKKNSPYQQELSEYIQLFRETGFMEHLKKKWWELKLPTASIKRFNFVVLVSFFLYFIEFLIVLFVIWIMIRWVKLYNAR